MEILYMIRAQSSSSREKMMLEKLIYFKQQVVNHPINIVKILKCITKNPHPRKANEAEEALCVPTTSAKK